MFGRCRKESYGYDVVGRRVARAAMWVGTGIAVRRGLVGGGGAGGVDGHRNQLAPSHERQEAKESMLWKKFAREE